MNCNKCKQAEATAGYKTCQIYGAKKGTNTGPCFPNEQGRNQCETERENKKDYSESYRKATKQTGIAGMILMRSKNEFTKRMKEKAHMPPNGNVNCIHVNEMVV
jgi:hypothetical protein